MVVDSVSAVGSSEWGRRVGWGSVWLGFVVAYVAAMRLVLKGTLVRRVDNLDAVREWREGTIARLVARFGPDVDDSGVGAPQDVGPAY